DKNEYKVASTLIEFLLILSQLSNTTGNKMNKHKAGYIKETGILDNYHLCKVEAKTIDENKCKVTSTLIEFLLMLSQLLIRLTIQKQIHCKAKFFSLESFSKPTSNFLTNLKKKPFDRLTFYNLITLQAPK
ncbi:31500_t:CDS:2, partial [Racocetra persica]